MQLVIKNGTCHFRRQSNFARLLSKLGVFAALAVVFAMGINSARAFTAADANTSINAYLSQFYTTFGNGQANILSQQNTGGATYMWGQAEEIEGILDAYERTGNPAYKTAITYLINGFSSNNGTNWCSWDIYNDDVCWACIAYLRAYQDTGDAQFRSIAKFNFDTMYARAWDTSFLGGGLWWNTGDYCKNACINGPATIVSYLLYQSLTNATYLTKAQNIYNWEKTNLFNASSGAIYDNVSTNSANSSTWSSTYNQGTFIGAATFLGDMVSARQAMNFTMNDMGQPTSSGFNILPEYGAGSGGNNSGFNSIGLRWMCRFMITNGLQSTYLPWLQANVNAAVGIRRTSDNLSWCDWEHPTPANTNLYSWDCLSSMDALQVVPPGGNSLTNYYRIVNLNSGQCLDLIGAATTNGAPVSQFTINTNLPEQEWAIQPSENQNAFTIVSKVTGFSAGISGNATSNGAVLLDSGYVSYNAGQQFTLTYVTNGCFNLVNVNSGLVLGVAGNGVTNNAPIVQTTASGSASQLWILQPVGEYYIRADSDYYVCIAGEGSANGDEIVTYSWQPNPWFQWNFVNKGSGWFGCFTLNAPASVVDITGPSTTPGANLDLHTYSGSNLGDQKVTVFPQYNGTVKFYFAYDNQTWDINDNYNINAQLIQNTNNSNPWQTYTMEPVPTLPAVPGGLQAFGGYGLAGLDWTAAVRATNYIVSRSTISGAETVIGHTTNTSYIDPGLSNGTTYYYVVTAQNAAGQTPTIEVSATPQAPLPGTYQAALAADHPLAYWPLSETNSSLAFDPVGGHIGTYVGGVGLAQPGVALSGFGSANYSAQFNGTSAYVDVPGAPFNIKSAVTEMAWVNLPVAPRYSGIMGHGNNSWRLSFSAAGDPAGADGGSADAASSTSITGTGWHLVAYTYSGVPSSLSNGSLYVDGVLAANDTVPAPVGDTYDVWLGGAPDYGTGRLITGNLAHTAIFTQALSAAQVLALYQAASKPAIPVVQAMGGYGLVSLNWAAAAGATNYIVARSTSSGAEVTVGATDGTNYADLGLTNGTTYYYVVTAQNSQGLGGASTEVPATPQAPEPGSYEAAVLAGQPLAYWPLAETNGTVAFDPVGGHNGTYIGGVTLAQPGVTLAGFAPPSYAALFDGVSGYVDMPEGPFDLTNAITTVAWVSVPAAGHYSEILGHGNSSYQLSVNAAGQPGGADGGGAATSGTSLAGTGWHMVAYVYDGIPSVANNGALYVDGALAAYDTVFALTGSGYDLWIGGAPDFGTNRLFRGGISHAAVFNQALSAAQILALYQAGAKPAAPSGVAATAGYGLVSLNWTTTPGVTSYTVARSTISGAEVTVGTTTNGNYIDRGLTDGTNYYYVVTARNSAGVSGASAEVSATPEPPEPGSYEAAVVADGPLAYWPLAETSGTVAFDPVGGHNGTYLGGVTLAQPGVPLAGFATPSYSALFDGISGYVDVPEGSFNLTAAVTLLAWVNVPETPHFSSVIGHGDSSWRMSVSASGDPGGADGGNGDATSGTSIVGSGWHMLAYVYSGASGVVNNGSLYVDGVLKAHDTDSSLAGNGYDVWIGGAPDYGAARLLPGGIAHAAVFSKALSAAQVLALYTASSVAPPVTLSLVPAAGGGSLTLKWTGGALLQSSSLLGPWTTNNAVSPYTVGLTNSQMYFRVVGN